MNGDTKKRKIKARRDVKRPQKPTRKAVSLININSEAERTLVCHGVIKRRASGLWADKAERVALADSNSSSSLAGSSLVHFVRVDALEQVVRELVGVLEELHVVPDYADLALERLELADDAHVRRGLALIAAAFLRESRNYTG